jgi:CubicO group peptidase (beta-lactamase class C family)
MMSRYARILLAVGAMSWGAVTAAGAAEPVPRDQASIVAEARAIIEAYSELGWFSGSALVAHDGAPVLEVSVGMANRETRTPNSRETRYNLGSIMKHYTAVLVLQQVEAGAIGLDDTLEKFDLGFPPGVGASVTVRHLLHHRSGFADVFTAEYREDPLAFETIAQKLRLLQDSALLFEPGSDYRYSNYGYVVLGAILEKVTGRPFAVLLRESIFAPLGLDDSAYPYPADLEQQSLRYTFNHAGEQVFVGVTEHHGPDGGIEATTADVLSFYRALFYGDELLSPEDGVMSEYFAPRGDHWSAFGGGAGVSSAVELDLANNYQVVVLANTDQLVAEEISGRICSYIRTGSYDPVMLPPQAYAWQAYRDMGEDAFAAGFRERYASAGYTRFVGRTVNELGMSLLDAEQWDDAFTVFGALAAWFPDAPQVYDSLAYAHWRMDELERAQALFKKALALQPGFSSDYSAHNYGVEGP